MSRKLTAPHFDPWGSGKSSVINLIRHHLEKDAPDLDVNNFPAWMYKTEDAMAEGFFKELNAGLSPVLSDHTKAAGDFASWRLT